MAQTKIEWCDKVWNPVTGCDPVSEGCRNCYAARMAKRLAGRCGYPADDPFRVTVQSGKLEDPFWWKKPARVFVNSMGDLFHEFLVDYEESYLNDIFAVMALTPHITFQILTKRSHLMKKFVNDPKRAEYVEYSFERICDAYGWHSGPFQWPLPNVWLGVTAENQETADERIPLLLETPAAVRFVSVEPMLEAVDIGMSTATCKCCDRWSSRWVDLNRVVRSDIPSEHFHIYAEPGIHRAESNPHGALSVKTNSGELIGIKPDEFSCLPKLDWVICGGETGPGARPMHPDWVRSLRDQCVSAGVPFFFKGWGEWKPISEMTEAETEKYYEPAPERYPEAIRRCKVETRAIRFDGGDDFFLTDGHVSYSIFKVGKKRSGRLLDGREWNEFPQNPPCPPSGQGRQGG